MVNVVTQCGTAIKVVIGKLGSVADISLREAETEGLGVQEQPLVGSRSYPAMTWSQ